MNLELELGSPTWYSRESMYVSEVKLCNLDLEGPCVNLLKEGVDLAPSKAQQDEIKEKVCELIAAQASTWFTSPLSKAQIEKRMTFTFPKFEYETQDRWVKATWAPQYFQVQKKGFVLVFKITAFSEGNPRIPFTFLESITPRATTPTEETETVRNIVLQPGAGPTTTDLEEGVEIPLSETQGSFEIRDERMREKQKLRAAKLRAAIARLKVEEMRERYLRHYGDEYLEESSDSEDEASDGSEFSEPVSKK